MKIKVQIIIAVVLILILLVALVFTLAAKGDMGLGELRFVKTQISI